MSVVVSVKVRDGIVLGADSAASIRREVKGEIETVKVFYNAQKLFSVADLPMGILTWGTGNIGERSIQGVLDDFSDAVTEKDDPPESVEDVASELRAFLEDKYRQELEGIPTERWPSLGIFVAGYSPDSPHGQEWEFEIPGAPPDQVRDETVLGASWRGIGKHITRAVNGWDPQLRNGLLTWAQEHTDEVQEFQQVQGAFRVVQSDVVFDGMPLQEAVYYAEFLLNLTKRFERFEAGAPRVGGPLRLACLTRKQFNWLADPLVEPREQLARQVEMVR